MRPLCVDFRNRTDKIKPLNGFNNAARKTGYGELLPAFRALKPPIVRLHDTCGKYGGAHYVDVPNVFPDFNADPDDPSSYDFTLTDLYLKPLVEDGIEIMYRLGVTIEHEPKKYRIYPPEDPGKWAAVCEHIVRHYNEGWANGYQWNIRYWEIWNEPDGLAPDIEPFGQPNWKGSAEDYYRLYSVTANHLKQNHPGILIGGYSSCYILGRFENGKWTPGPTDFFTDFLAYISAPETKAPLDFFTWHGYLGKSYVDKLTLESEFVSETLDRFGFRDTLRIDAEWNCMIADDSSGDARTQQYVNLRNEKSASHVAAALYLMQHRRIDAAMYYDAQLWCEYGALFHVPSLQPAKSYYAMAQFSELRDLRNHCPTAQRDGVYSCAAAGNYEMLCIANPSASERTVPVHLEGFTGTVAEISLCDATHDLDLIERKPAVEDMVFRLSPYSFISIKIKKESDLQCPNKN